MSAHCIRATAQQLSKILRPLCESRACGVLMQSKPVVGQVTDVMQFPEAEILL
jgi:hypothetical protein